MANQEFTPVEQRFIEASTRPDVTVRRRRMVIFTALTLVATIILAAVLQVSRTFFVIAFVVYVLVTLWEKVTYANGVLVYKGIIRKLVSRRS